MIWYHPCIFPISFFLFIVFSFLLRVSLRYILPPFLLFSHSIYFFAFLFPSFVNLSFLACFLFFHLPHFISSMQVLPLLHLIGQPQTVSSFRWPIFCSKENEPFHLWIKMFLITLNDFFLAVWNGERGIPRWACEEDNSAKANAVVYMTFSILKMLKMTCLKKASDGAGRIQHLIQWVLLLSAVCNTNIS